MATGEHFYSLILPKSIGTFLLGKSMITSNIKLMDEVWMKLWYVQAFSAYFHKMTAIDHFGFPIFAKINRILPFWVINVCVKYECDMGIYVTVT